MRKAFARHQVTHGIRAVATSPLRAPAPFPASRPLAAPGSIDLPDLKQAFEALKTDVQSLRQQLGALTRAKEGSKPDTASEGQTAGPLGAEEKSPELPDGPLEA
ncbi:unnamed protein product [Effrenium voratum]|nr:unnamed protein product [Effrenium voratum]